MIHLNDVSKRFRLYGRPVDHLLEWAGLPGRYQDFWALSHISLHVPAGRAIGIIGPNGAGKSTLLKLVTGTLLPTEGTIEVGGRVAALLELGTGFHGEFTGRQNIWINGQLLGLSPDEIAANEPGIIAFSELGAFIDQPIRTYSSGMVVRLGFAIAASVNPQVLIVDEALSVGDARFAQKCIRRIREFREHGCTILFVSHDPGAISTLCEEAILLDQGEVVHFGWPADVLEHYNALLATRGQGNVEMKVHWVRGASGTEAPVPRRSGTFQSLVTRLELLGADGEPAEIFVPRSRMTLRVGALFLAPVSNPTVGILIKDRLGAEVYGTNTRLHGERLGDFGAGESVEVSMEIPLDITDGDYSVTVAVHSDETHLDACYDWTDRMGVFLVRSAGKPRSIGRVILDPEFRQSRQAATPGEVRAALVAAFGELPDPLPVSGLAPSPFLHGFSAPAGSDGRMAREAVSGALFVMQPRGARVAFEAVVAGEDAPKVALVPLGGGRIEGRWSDAGLEFLLPSECVGKPGLFEIRLDGAGQGAQLPIYGIHSLQVREVEVPCPVTTARN